MKVHKHSGFTIVELLIVIVVIAILAAISIVAYNGIQDRANNTVVEADIANLAKKIEAWKITNGGNYPTVAELSGVGIRISKGSYLTTSRNNFYYCATSDAQQYSFGIVSKTNKGYFLTNGKVDTQNGDSTYQSNTCAKIGLPNGDTGTSGYGGGSGIWASWIGG